MKKKLNQRCPLQAECERKCEYEGKELECSYYEANARPGYELEDQEAVRRQRWGDEDDGFAAGELVYIPIDQLYPHPKNPRKDLGDLTELTESIKAKGILQNLTVVRRVRDMTGEEYKAACEAYRADPTEEGQRTVNRHKVEDGYTIIIGHRRHAGGKQAGLTELPCVITQMDEAEQLQTMLMENVQRSDLTAYEQAWGFQTVLDMGVSVPEIAQKSGFSQKTVRSRLEIAKLDKEALEEACERQLSLADFDRLAKIESIETRNKLLKDIGTNNFDMAIAGALKAEHRKKVTPAAKKQLKELGAKPLDKEDRYSSKYETIKTFNLDAWKPEKGLGVKNDGEQLFYYLDEKWGGLTFYRKRKKSAPEKKPPEQLAREKAIAEAHAALKSETALAFGLRRDFVKRLTVTRENTPLLLRGAAIAIAASSVTYNGTDRDGILLLLGVDPSGESYESREKAIKAAAGLENNDLAPGIIYAAFNDNEKSGYHSTYTGEWPKHKENLALDALYAWLELMGYEMSDVEKALQNGTHGLFNDGGESVNRA